VLEIGNSLREARRRRGVGLPEASAATMIRSRYLEALEDERVDLLPEGPYQRSFLREYAEYLGLDGDILVVEWLLQFPDPTPELPSPPDRAAVVRGTLSRLDPLALTLVLTIVAVAIAAWQFSGSGSTKVQASPALAAPKPNSRTVVREKPRPAAGVAVHTTSFAALALTAAHGPCWLIARLGSSVGPVLAERTLQQGQTARFGLRKPLWIRLGAPWNLAASIGRRSITSALPAVTANVLFTARGAKSA
jgi:hypothetical protein